MKIKFAMLLWLITSTVIAQHGHYGMTPDKPSTHGMLIFGNEKIYASHLPLFHSPHDYQIILELELIAADKKKFIADQQLHPEFTTYSIEPEKFVLPDMIASPKPFKVNVYRGHFERGSTALLEQVTVTIRQVIYFKKLNLADVKDTSTKFILFGNSKEQYAAHRLSNKPDFEQIMQVSSNIIDANKYELINFISDVNAPVGVSGNSIISADNKKIFLLKQLYLEFNDLKE